MNLPTLLTKKTSLARRIVLVITAVALIPTLSLSAQTTATWIGPATGGLWSNPANWDIGAVPINNGGNTYNVIVPAGRSVVFDLPGANNIAGLNLQDTGQINFSTGRSLNVTGFTLVAGNIVANGAGSGFSANSPLTVFQPSPALHAADGAVIQINATSYVNNRIINGTLMSALGSGSQLNLQSITSLDSNAIDTGGQYFQTIEAGQGGLINLSGVQTVDGDRENDVLRFWIHTGGNIMLQNLTTITKTNAFSGGRTLFDLEVPIYSLPNLHDADGVEFKIRSGNSVQLPSLTSMRDSRLDLGSGATFNAPSLTDFRGTYLRISGGASFNTSQLLQIADSSLHVHSGGSITTSATSYVNNRIVGGTLMSALGSGSQLNLQSITSLDSNAIDMGGQYFQTIEAGQGGLINLLGVHTIDGDRENDVLRFWVHTGGNIDLQNLTTITKTNALPGGRTLFDVDSGSYTLPNLVSANGAEFDAAPFVTINLPQLASLVDGRLDVGALESINAPLLGNVQGSYIRVSGGSVANTSAFSSINDASLNVHSGGSIITSSLSYVNNRIVGGTLMSATGSGSQLNLQSIISFNSNAIDTGGQYFQTIEAGQGGVISLSGLRSIDGDLENEVLRFFSSGTGRINIGSVGQTTNLVGGRTRFEVTGTNSVIRFGSNMSMAANTEMKAALNGRFEAEGDLVIKSQSAANFDLADGQLRMIGVAPVDDQGAPTEHQFLEVASTDNGLPTGAISNNFQIGVLQIGTSTIKSSVMLQNSFNNNSNPTDVEALYLQGFPAETGLRLLNGSNLILNGMNAYFSNGQGQWTSARSLIASGQIATVFGGGVISLTSPVGTVVNGDFEDGNGLDDEVNDTSHIIGWNVKGAGTATWSLGDFGSRENQRVLKLTAGSEVEVWQQVSTSDEAFFIGFDAFALNSTGSLSLVLDEQVLRTWTIAELTGSDVLRFEYLVSDPGLWGAIDVPLALRWNANTGHSILIDNWSMFAAVPEPGSAAALLALCTLLSGLRRRSRTLEVGAASR